MLPDGVYDLSQELPIGEIINRPCAARALDDLAAESFDLVGRHPSAVVIESVTGFELLAVRLQNHTSQCAFPLDQFVRPNNRRLREVEADCRR